MLQNLIAILDPRSAHPLDRLRHAMMAWTVQPLSPGSIALALTDWCVHLGMYAAKQGELLVLGADQWLRLANRAAREWQGECPAPCIHPLAHDNRFRDKAWGRWPFSFLYQAFLLQEQWWHHATSKE